MRNLPFLCTLSLMLMIANLPLSAQDAPFDFEAHTQMVSVKGESFPCVDFGSGPVVLLLHGFPDTRELWKYQIPALAAAGYRVLAPDLRGAGGAPRTLAKEAYAIPRLMIDVIGIMEALKVEKAHLVGHDWGAALAWVLATYQADRFFSLTALSVGAPGSVGWNSFSQREKSWYFYLFLQEGLAEHTIREDDWAFFRTFLQSHRDREAILQRMTEPDALTTALNWYRGNMQDMLAPTDGSWKSPETTAPSRPTIALPVMGIWGENDPFLLEPQMLGAAERVSGSWTYHTLKGAGHWMMLEKPQKLNKLLLDFFEQHKT